MAKDKSSKAVIDLIVAVLTLAGGALVALLSVIVALVRRGSRRTVYGPAEKIGPPLLPGMKGERLSMRLGITFVPDEELREAREAAAAEDAKDSLAVFDEHFEQNPDCDLGRFLSCHHSRHRPKEKTREDCERGKRTGWPRTIRGHARDVRQRLAQGEELRFAGYRIDAMMCACPHTADLVGRRLTKAQVVEAMGKLPFVCLWNFNVRPEL